MSDPIKDRDILLSGFAELVEHYRIKNGEQANEIKRMNQEILDLRQELDDVRRKECPAPVVDLCEE